MKGNLHLLLEKIMHVIKENLLDVIRSRDGIYSLLFVKNCFNYLIENSETENERRMETLKLMQREFNAIMTELAGKEKKEEKNEEENSNMDTAMNSDDLNVSMISDDTSYMNQSINQDNSSNSSLGIDLSQNKSTS